MRRSRRSTGCWSPPPPSEGPSPACPMEAGRSKKVWERRSANQSSRRPPGGSSWPARSTRSASCSWTSADEHRHGPAVRPIPRGRACLCQGATQPGQQRRAAGERACREGQGPCAAVEGATAGAVFEACVGRALAPSLRPGQVVVMDNLSAHEGQRVRELVQGRGCCELLLLPPYSPDLNPILSRPSPSSRPRCGGPSCAGVLGS